MSGSATCPASRSKVVDLYFLEHRAKLLDLAAFLDRYDRAADDQNGCTDFRIAALCEAVKILLDDQPGRAKRVQELFSDMTDQPIPNAPMQGALGAPPNRAYAGIKGEDQ